MPRTVTFEGKQYKFPDDASDSEISEALEQSTKAPTYGEVLNKWPGAFKGQLQKIAGGAVEAVGDLTRVDALSKAGRGIGEIASETIEANTPKNMTLGQDIVSTAATSLGLSLPAIPLGIAGGVLRGVGTATTFMGATTAASEYSENRAADIPGGRAALHSAFAGAVEKYTEYLPAKYLFGSGRAQKSFIKDFLGKELLGEEIATVLQDINAKLSHSPHLTLGDIARDMVVTAGAVGLTAPVQAGIVRGAQAMLPESTLGGEQTQPPAPATPPPAVAATPGSLGNLITPPNAPAQPVVSSDGALMDLVGTKGAPAPEMVRMYAVVPTTMTAQNAPESVIFTSSPELAQQRLDAFSGDAKVTFYDFAPKTIEMLDAQRRNDPIQEQKVDPKAEAALPGIYAVQGEAIYQPVPKQQVTPPAAVIDEQDAQLNKLAEQRVQPSSLHTAENLGRKSVTLYHGNYQGRDAGSGDIGVHYTADPEVAAAKGEVSKVVKNFKNILQVNSEPQDGAWHSPARVIPVLEEAGVVVPKPLKTFSAALEEQTSIVAGAENMQPAQRETLDRLNKVVQDAGYDAIAYENQYEGGGLSYIDLGAKYGAEAFASKLAIETPVREGVVAVAPDVLENNHVKRMKNTLQRWVKVFSPRMKILIIGEATGDHMGRFITREDGTVLIEIPPRLGDNGKELGAVIQTFILAHEFGHALTFYHFRAASKEVQDAVTREWLSLVNNLHNMTAGQYLQQWGNPARLEAFDEVLKTYGVKASDPALKLTEAIDAKVGIPGYATSFTEYQAEQFSRYVAKHTNVAFPENSSLTEVLKDIYFRVKDFFERVVLKLQIPVSFEKWVHSMTVLDGDSIGYPIRLATDMFDTNEALAVNEQQTALEALNTFTYTTSALERVFARFPNQDRIKKQWILEELTRSGVKKAEKTLFLGTLDEKTGQTTPGLLEEFPEPTVEKTVLLRRIQEILIPITQKPVTKYNSYGWRAEHFLEPIRAHEGDTNNQLPIERTSILYEVPFNIATSKHFSEYGPRYFAHQRIGVIGGSVATVEMQSDLMQRITPITYEAATKARADAAALSSVSYNAEEAIYKQYGIQNKYNDEARRILKTYLTFETLEQEALKEFSSSQAPMEFIKAERSYDPELTPIDLSNKISLRSTELSGRWNNSIWALKEELQNANSTYESHKNNAKGINQPLVRAAYDLEVEKAKKVRDEVQRKIDLRPALMDMLPYYKPLLLRLHIHGMAQLGYKTVWFANAQLTALGEMWPSFTEVNTHVVETLHGKDPQFRKEWAERDKSGVQDLEIVLQSLVRQTSAGFRGAKNDHVGKSYYQKLLKQAKEESLVYDDNGRLIDPILLEPAHTIIFQSYEKEIQKALTQEFNAEFVPTWGDRSHIGTRDTKYSPFGWYKIELTDTHRAPVKHYHPSENLASTGMVTQAEVIKDKDPVFSAAFQRLQGFYNQFLQLNQMSKLLPDFEPLTDYRRAMQKMANLKNRMLTGPDARIIEWDRLGKAQSNGVEKFLRDEVNRGAHWTEMVITPTEINGVMKDIWTHVPTEAFETEMVARGLNADAAKLIIGIKNDFLFTLQSMEEVLKNSVDNYFKGNPLSAQFRRAEIHAEFEELRKQPYLPDRRFGKWAVYVHSGVDATVNGRNIKKGELVYWSAFESKASRDKHFEEMQKEYGSEHRVSTGYREDVHRVTQGLPRSFVNDLVKVLALDPVQIEAIQKLQYDHTKSGAYEKLLRREKKFIGGASEDIRRSYSDYHWHAANHIAKLQYSRELQRAMRGVAAAGKDAQHSDPYNRLHEYLRKNFDYVMQPQDEWERLRSAVSLWYLWGSAKTALINGTSVATLTYPYLAAKYGDIQATASIVRAIKDVALYWKNPKLLREDKQRVLEQATNDGVTDQSFAADMAGAADGHLMERMYPEWKFLRNSDASKTARKATRRILDMGMKPFRTIEQLNRQITLLAAYDLEVAKTGLRFSTNEMHSYMVARDAVDYTQNEFAPWNKAPFIRGKKGVFLIFYSFVQHMSFFMFGGDKGWWRAMFIMMALAGLQGLPGIENLIDMLNWAWKKFAGEHIDLRLEAREVAQAIGLNPDIAMHGLSRNLLGWSADTSIGMGRVIPGTDAIFGEGDVDQRLMRAVSEVGGPAASLFMSFVQGLADEHPDALMRFDRILPPALRNLERAYRYGTEGVKTRDGATLLADVETSELVGTALGFAPTVVATEQERMRVQRDVAEYYIGRRKVLLQAHYLAKLSGDMDVMSDVKERIAEFNANAPEKSLVISPKEIALSYRARDRLRKKIEAEQSPIQRYQQQYQDVAELFGG